jgi:hypothetical protein
MESLGSQPHMSDKNPAPSAPKTVSIKRFQIGVNVLVQIATTVLILGMVNYLAFNHYKRWDFSRSQKFALADQTKRVLANLKKPVTIIVFFSPAFDIYSDVDNLLKEYQYAGRKKVEIEFVDPYRNLSRARELQAKYKFGADENVVILDYDGHSKLVNGPDLAEYDSSGAMFGQPPKLTAFKGEQALTSALLEIVEARQNKVYFLGGQGEMELKDAKLTNVKTFIQRQNIKLEALNLLNVDAVPKDASALFIAGAKYDFSEREIKLLKEYWTAKGRLFVCLDPAGLTPRLLAFLGEVGVKPDDDRVLRTVNLGPVTGIVRDVTAVFVEGSPITKQFKGVNSILLGTTQSLTLDARSVAAANIKLQPLLQAGEGFWGETDYNIDVNKGDVVIFDANKDHAAPLTIAASIEKGALSDTRVQVDSSRMIVVGNADFVANDALTEVNVDFLLGGFNWLMAREEIIGVAPKVSKTFNLNLSNPQISKIATLTMGAIPVLAALFGLAAWWKRTR